MTETVKHTHYEASRIPWTWTFFLVLALGVGDSTAGAQPGPVTPYQFGAVGDGFIDDSTAVQAAIDTGDGVDLAGGKFKITQVLRIASGSLIEGPGTLIQAFDLKPPSSPQTAHALLAGGGNNIRLANFRIAKTSGDGSYSNGVVLDNGKEIVLHGLEISGYSARYGIHLIEVSNFEVSHCYIHDFMMNTSADMIEDSPAGLRITRSHHGIVSNNRILRIQVGPVGRESLSPIRPEYGKQGYQSDGMTIQESDRVTIEGNVCETAGEGIDLLLSRSCILSGNVISDNWLLGVKMLGVAFTTATDNHISDCYQGIQVAYHPGFETEASGNVLNGNLFRDIGSPGSFGVPASQRSFGGIYGIHLRNVGEPDGCRYNMVSDNVIVDTQVEKTTEAGVRNDAGETNRIEDNIFTDQVTE
jgi:parallel beta-helix repeat protein